MSSGVDSTKKLFTTKFQTELKTSLRLRPVWWLLFIFVILMLILISDSIISQIVITGFYFNTRSLYKLTVNFMEINMYFRRILGEIIEQSRVHSGALQIQGTRDGSGGLRNFTRYTELNQTSIKFNQNYINAYSQSNYFRYFEAKLRYNAANISTSILSFLGNEGLSNLHADKLNFFMRNRISIKDYSEQQVYYRSAILFETRAVAFFSYIRTVLNQVNELRKLDVFVAAGFQVNNSTSAPLVLNGSNAFVNIWRATRAANSIMQNSFYGILSDVSKTLDQLRISTVSTEVETSTRSLKIFFGCVAFVILVTILVGAFCSYKLNKQFYLILTVLDHLKTSELEQIHSSVMSKLNVIQKYRYNEERMIISYENPNNYDSQTSIAKKKPITLPFKKTRKFIKTALDKNFKTYIFLLSLLTALTFLFAFYILMQSLIIDFINNASQAENFLIERYLKFSRLDNRFLAYIAFSSYANYLQFDGRKLEEFANDTSFEAFNSDLMNYIPSGLRYLEADDGEIIMKILFEDSCSFAYGSKRMSDIGRVVCRSNIAASNKGLIAFLNEFKDVMNEFWNDMIVNERDYLDRSFNFTAGRNARSTNHWVDTSSIVNRRVFDTAVFDMMSLLFSSVQRHMDIEFGLTHKLILSLQGAVVPLISVTIVLGALSTIIIARWDMAV